MADDTDRAHAAPKQLDKVDVFSSPIEHAKDSEELKKDGEERTGATQIAHGKLVLDTGETRMKMREHVWQIWRPKDPPPPPPASLDEAPMIPLARANIFAVLTYTWLSDIMRLGYQRTLQATDLWKLDEKRQAAVLSSKLDAAWDRRCKAAAEWNDLLSKGEINPGVLKRLTWTVKGRRAERERKWREKDGLKHASLAWALNEVFGFDFWCAGLFKVVGDTSQLMAPIVVRTIINFGKTRQDGEIGRGAAMAVGLFLLTVTTSICQHQFFWRSMTTGVLARAALIASLYKRGVHLTTKSRVSVPNAALINHISTDVSRIDAAAQWFHAGWTAPVQISICLIILCVQLGPSALAGFALFGAAMPIQERIMAGQLSLRRSSVIWTDKRAKLLLEILSSMRVVKYFTYEQPFLKRIFDIRYQELKSIRKIQFLRSTNLALAFSIPILAATLAFVVYGATSNVFDVAIVFSSLSLFNLLRQPLMLLPRALAAISDSKNAFERLSKVFHAPVRDGPDFIINSEQEDALVVKAASWEWEETMREKERREKEAAKKGKGKGKGDSEKEAKDKKTDEKSKIADDIEKALEQEEKPFAVKDVSFVVPRGNLVAIVGPVGCGKSSLLQGLLGEMRCTSGHVSFGGRVAYCPQTAWISNNTLRENVVFGAPFNEHRYWDAVEKACLLPDLEMLADGDLTEIGERGINLSGGQKQRVNLARALYYDADIVLLDDPLSAVDAHVGKALFHGAIQDLRSQGKAVVLVTHALHLLSQCDYIYTLGHGRIAEAGTFDELIRAGGEFARLDKAFGGAGREEEKREDEAKEGGGEQVEKVEVPQGDLQAMKQKSDKRSGAGTGKLEGRLIISEKRNTGSVGWKVYLEYLKAARGTITTPLLILTLILMQGSITMNAYTLVWWQTNSFHRSESFYMTLYGCLGISQAIWTFAVGAIMDIMSFLVSQNLHHHAVTNIFHAPMSFFDTTPLGRILGVFGKDIDTMDDQLSVSMRMFTIVIANVIGSIVLITVVEHYFIIAFFCVGFGYNYFAAFYRASAREIKRLDSMLRSLLYGHFSESLTGLPTIRSYGGIDRFVQENAYYVDLENRALFLSVTNQRWLAIRLDFMGGLMVFTVAMLAVSGASGINPAQMGVILAYTTQLSQILGVVTRQSAEVENYMNSVERVVHYSRGDLIEQEAPHEKPDTKPPSTWPSTGAIKMEGVTMAYRKDLPDVLKGITVDIKGGEKIGVVGRTGAGKSSLMLALFRIIELKSGRVTVDDIDISNLGLRDLRSKISIIPQDPLLFSGTVRSNLDPFSIYDDATLWDALRRSYLIEDTAVPSPVPSIIAHGDIKKKAYEGPTSGMATPRSQFTLESTVEAEGANLSQGQRSLLSIARALVKDSKVVILDEATASVDLATDSKIQDTIQTEFADRTLLCIAHRLRTILGYDRILVLDAGTVAEFDTPIQLFKKGGIFQSLCERSKISLDDIHQAKREI